VQLFALRMRKTIVAITVRFSCLIWRYTLMSSKAFFKVTPLKLESSERISGSTIVLLHLPLSLLK
jgi:hypothetical protein